LTDYPELDAVLGELVIGARTVLADNFCGSYLHGSFATGDADEFSDVDFVIVTHEDLTAGQEHGLRSLHRRLYALESPWAQHLEGSYIPLRHLRRMDWTKQPFLFLDNGANELAWDSHCNTAVVRWLLRERGLILAGPDPKELVEPITAADLEREARVRVREYAEWAHELPAMSAWEQPYLVLTFCRLLFTLATGRVAAKGEAGEWALEALDADWAGLVRQALADRADPWQRVHQPARHGLAERTVMFGDYAVRRADH
jgi:aminoglycoside adenylyltransferase-like protein/nucleotidyltransferase-like protein